MKTLSKNRNVFLFTTLLVPVVLLLLFVVYPSFDLLMMSFTSWDGVDKIREFIGLSNYKEMFLHSPDLWNSLRNNLIYFFLHLLMIPVEMMIAVMLNTKFKGAGFVKFLIFVPFIINGVGISYAFSYFFSPVNGGFNAVLEALGLSGLIRNWLSDPQIVNFVLAFVSLWKFSGYHVILFTAGIKSIPKDIEEAAVIDGANAFQKFRFIQVPFIALVLDFVLFDNVRGALQIFEIPYIMTSGGPGYASSTFTLYTIETAFKFNNFGMAATMAVATMVLIILFYLVESRLVNFFRKRGEQR